MIRRFSQLLTLFRDVFMFLKLRYLHPYKAPADKTILVDFKYPNLYHRYFYNLLKTFRIAGYYVHYPMSFSKFRNLRNGDIYIALLFKEKGLIDIRNKKVKHHIAILNDEMFSADYYKTYFVDQNAEMNSYHVPMSFHPYMYHYGHWNRPLPPVGRRKNAVFAFGNFDRTAYKKIHRAPFHIINRADLIDFLGTKPNFISAKSREYLTNLIKEDIDGRIVFAEKCHFEIQGEKVREYLSHFRYFLCCPGVFAPLSHNFVEALSAGCVPVIQKTYADLIYPPLQQNRNAIIFEDINDLDILLKEDLFKKTDSEFLKMEQEVSRYYAAYIHPKAAAGNILKNLHKTPVYLNASERSVALIK